MFSFKYLRNPLKPLARKREKGAKLSAVAAPSQQARFDACRDEVKECADEPDGQHAENNQLDIELGAAFDDGVAQAGIGGDQQKFRADRRHPCVDQPQMQTGEYLRRSGG